MARPQLSSEAFQKVQALMEQAADSATGIIYRCSEPTARRLYFEVGQLINALRVESKMVYPPGHHLWGRTTYDTLYVTPTELGLVVSPNRPSHKAPPPRTLMYEVVEKHSIKLQFSNSNAAYHYRHRCYGIRTKDRKENSKNPDSPMYNKSVFDSITFRLYPDGGLLLEVGLWDPENVEPLRPEDDPSLQQNIEAL